MFNKSVTLSNGVKMPSLGFGTYCISENDVTKAVTSAIEIGYRHIDSAQAYENEAGVGKAVSASDVKREEIFVVSKVAAEIKDYKKSAESIDESLKKFGLDYLDLMLIHCPQPWSEVSWNTDRYIEGNRQVWRSLEEAYKAGKLRAIGVSNFEISDIESIKEVCDIKPMVNQVMIHIGNTPKDLIKYCKSEGIVPEAYCPLGHGEIVNSEKIAPFAKKYGVTIPQFCIRYTLELGAVSIPKSTHPEYMKQNGEVDFEISKEDMRILIDM